MPKPEHTAEHFYLKLSLYEEVAWEDKEVFDVVDCLYFQGRFDCFCVECKKETTFSSTSSKAPKELTPAELERKKKVMAATVPDQLGVASKRKLIPPKIPDGVYDTTFRCARDDSHLLQFIYLCSSRTMDGNITQFVQKIGQHPSYGDLTIPELDKYKSVLPNEKLAEFKRGVGLSSHGIGIGSFVYLRRVFEFLLDEAKRAVETNADWDEENYRNSRIAGKVEILKSELPDFLVQNKSMYAILSKGIHELGEQECLDHFDVLKICIEITLDEELEKAEREKKRLEAARALSKVAGKLNGDNN